MKKSKRKPARAENAEHHKMKGDEKSKAAEEKNGDNDDDDDGNLSHVNGVVVPVEPGEAKMQARQRPPKYQGRGRDRDQQLKEGCRSKEGVRHGESQTDVAAIPRRNQPSPNPQSTSNSTTSAPPQNPDPASPADKQHNPEIQPKPKAKSHFESERPDWESLGLTTFWDINRSTGIAEELVVLRSGKAPYTPEYEWDAWVARRAEKSGEVIFQEFCLEMMRARRAGHVGKTTTTTTSDSYDFQGMSKSLPALPPYASAPLKASDGSFCTMTSWDYLLEEMRRRRRELCERRKWKIRGKVNEAGWACWEHRQRRLSRTEFVADDGEAELTAEMVTGNDGQGTRRQCVRLGYRREEDRGLGEHWVTREELLAIRNAESCQKAAAPCPS